MEKKKYVKPNMVVVKLKHRPCLFAGSGGTDPFIPEDI